MGTSEQRVEEIIQGALAGMTAVMDTQDSTSGEMVSASMTLTLRVITVVLAQHSTPEHRALLRAGVGRLMLACADPEVMN